MKAVDLSDELIISGGAILDSKEAYCGGFKYLLKGRLLLTLLNCLFSFLSKEKGGAIACV